VAVTPPYRSRSNNNGAFNQHISITGMSILGKNVILESRSLTKVRSFLVRKEMGLVISCRAGSSYDYANDF
jgi:hypothetical protein